jgi:integrase
MSALPSIQQAIDAFFSDFDFGEDGERTYLSYRSGARAFLRFVEEHETLDLNASIAVLPSSVTADFRAWLQAAEHSGPGRPGEEGSPISRSYSPASVKLYLQALNRLLRFWWFRQWLSFSPEEESEARRALQIQRVRGRRERTRTRSPDVPSDFGDRMLEAASTLPLPTAEAISDPRQRRRMRLEVLRAQALIHTLRATALRAGDLCGLTHSQIELARVNNGYLAVPMRKTGLPAHVVLGEAVLSAIDAYLKERNDDSPFVFIQHGRTGAPPRKRSPSPEAYRGRKKGYGAQISTGLVRKIVLKVARRAGYNPQKEFISAHAFRHWHAQRLIRLGASIDQVQSVLGHARAQTTKEIYAPEPNVPQILEWEEAIQRPAQGISDH